MAVRDVVQAAAGVGGGDKLYVEDVFSTYLYTGNGSTQIIENGIALGDTNAGPCVPFSGNQYLSRTSDLTGNSDGSTFTLSFWAFVTNSYNTIFRSNSGRVEVLIQPNNMQFDFKNTSGTSIWRGNSNSGTVKAYQWNHILISVDAGSSAQIYINDVSSGISYVANNSGTFDFTDTSWGIGAPANGGYQPIQGKLTEFFFDKTYRNLGTVGNRRLFITADGEPATGLASLNPLIYLPLNGTVSVGTNEGTGGDFVPINGLSSSETGGPYTEAGYGEGGMVWVKSRLTANHHILCDTARGVNSRLSSNLTNSTYTNASVTAFNSNGFTLDNNAFVTGLNDSFTSWTLRKSPKFFDVVTWTGNGVAGREIPHSLGSVPGCIIIKVTNDTSKWVVYHRSLGGTKYLSLNETTAASVTSVIFNNTDPTDTVFTLGGHTYVNGLDIGGGVPGTYVAYVFAHDAGGFGDDGEQNIISCGSYVGNGSSAGPVITLGWEPQWMLIKDTTSGVQDWVLQDTMRGMTVTAGVGAYVKPNTSSAEFSASYVTPQPTGFQINNTSGQANTAGNRYIYMAIRRPMKTPEAGTEVFVMDTMSNTDPSFTSGFPVDMSFHRQTTAGPNWAIASRLTGKAAMYTDLTGSESTEGANVWDFMDGWHNYPGTVSNWYAWMFKRAPGFFDVVATPQTAAGAGTVTHNLGVAPEFIILKGRDYTESWRCYHAALGRGATIQLNLPDAQYLSANYWGVADPTATEFGVSWNAFTAPNYIAYLFASLDGVSKVGNYTGTGANLNVDCGFSAGARFILIKRTDASGDWYVWDSVRGIVAGNDPYLLLNSTAAEVTNTDYIDPLASGFTVTSSAPAALNASGGSYIFLAIA